MEQSEYKRGYSRGYWRGSQGAWPDHRPLVPPHSIVGPIVEAARALRDAADHICATLAEDDEFTQELGPHVDAFDEAVSKYGEWLRGNEPNGIPEGSGDA